MTTKVKLDCKVLHVEGQEFDITHAERLLQYQQQHRLDHWQLSPKQKFEFKNGVISPTGTGADKAAGE